MRQTSAAPQPVDALTLIAATWFASGCVLLGLTPLPWHDATLGWSPAFWLLAAPCLLLVAKALCAGRTPGCAASRDHRERRARSNAYPMPMASRVRPRIRERAAGPAQRIG